MLNVLGMAAGFTGDPERAEAYFAEALAIRREIGDRGGVARCLGNLGATARYKGRPQTAARYLEESLSIARELGLQACYPLIYLAAIQASSGQAEGAWRTWREALGEAVAIGAAAPVPTALAIAAGWLAQAGLYERAAELVGVARDRAVDIEPQIESEPALAILRQALSASELEAAMARGRALDLDAVVAELLAEGAD